MKARRVAAPAAAPELSFASMFETHADEVYRYIHRRCRDHSLSEDITQETFMTAIRSGKDPGALSIGWLLTVARNRLFDVLRRQVSYEDKLRLLGFGGESAFDDEWAERVRIEQALSELRVDHRLVLTLHYIDGLTVPELAAQLGRSTKSAEGLITRARRALRDVLGDDLGTGSTTQRRVDAERGDRHV